MKRKKKGFFLVLVCFALGGCESPASDADPEAPQTEPVVTPDSRTAQVSFVQTADGSVAGGELALFTVDTGPILDGGERNFTLTVTEPGKEPGTVEVNLEVEADLSQRVGVFFVQEDGRLLRISPENAETYANTYYTEDKASDFERTPGAGKWRMNFAEVDTLFEALIWVDQYAKSGTAERFQEYRIRVEKDEAFIPTALTCGGRADYVCFTLWGYQEERTIIRDAFTANPQHTGISYKLVSGSSVSLIQVGFSDLKPIALRLGANITIDAEQEKYNAIPGTSGGWEHHIVHIYGRGILIMETGSTLTNHKGNAVWLLNDGDSVGLFEMKGGAITNCSETAVGLAREYTEVLGYTTKTFRFYSGSLVNNYNDNLIALSNQTSAVASAMYLPWTYFAVNE